jgi:hypothetical protein
MSFLTKIFDYLFSYFITGFDVSNIADLETLLTVGSDVLVVFSWVKLFIPVQVIGILLGLTTMYYVVRFVWALIKIVRSVIIGNNSFVSLFKGGS